jgi:hypothetical protein
MTQAELLAPAANAGINETNVKLVGFIQNRIEFVG